MAKQLSVKTECRVVPVRFQRAIIGEPDRRYPDIDARGFNHDIPAMNKQAASTAVRSSAVSIADNHEVEIQLVREDIGEGAVLYVSSSDPGVFEVLDPVGNAPCTPGKTCNIGLRTHFAVSIKPDIAYLNVHFGKKDGPVIARLLVYVMPRMMVNVSPHFVTINSAASLGQQPALDFNRVAKLTADIWYNAGVQLVFAKTSFFAINAAKADYLEFDEVDTVLQKKWNKGHINLYVVQELEDALGYGFSTQIYAKIPLIHPAAFVGLQISGKNALDRSNDAMYCANDIAHEIGHFFTLRHPSDDPENGKTDWQRFDSWSMRFLMHNWNTTGRDTGKTPNQAVDWPDFNTFGYGSGAHGDYRGAAIPLKKILLGGPGIDGHCATARNHIAKGGTTLYGK